MAARHKGFTVCALKSFTSKRFVDKNYVSKDRSTVYPPDPKARESEPSFPKTASTISQITETQPCQGVRLVLLQLREGLEDKSTK